MNWPGMNFSRGSRRSGLFQLRIVRVAEVRDDRVALVDQRDAAVQVGDDDQALVLVEVAGQPEAGDEVDVLAVQREALQAVVAAIGDDQRSAAAPRVSIQMPCGSISWPGSEPRPPNVRMCSALALYWLM